MQKVYLAGAIHNANNPDGWRDDITAQLGPYWQAVNPLAVEPPSMNGQALVQFDFNLILSCDAVVVEASRPSWGTAIEMRFAWENRIPTIGLRDRSWKDVSAWLIAHLDVLCRDTQSVLAALNRMDDADLFDKVERSAVGVN